MTQKHSFKRPNKMSIFQVSQAHICAGPTHSRFWPKSAFLRGVGESRIFRSSPNRPKFYVPLLETNSTAEKNFQLKSNFPGRILAKSIFQQLSNLATFGPQGMGWDLDFSKNFRLRPVGARSPQSRVGRHLRRLKLVLCI